MCDSINGSLGPDALELMVSEGLLDNSENPSLFKRQLKSVFGSCAGLHERIIIKELYRRLGLSSMTNSPFDYGESLAVARQVYSALSRSK
jgi:hypothetical protein